MVNLDPKPPKKVYKILDAYNIYFKVLKEFFKYYYQTSPLRFFLFCDVSVSMKILVGMANHSLLCCSGHGIWSRIANGGLVPETGLRDLLARCSRSKSSELLDAGGNSFHSTTFFKPKKFMDGHF